MPTHHFQQRLGMKQMSGCVPRKQARTVRNLNKQEKIMKIEDTTHRYRKSMDENDDEQVGQDDLFSFQHTYQPETHENFEWIESTSDVMDWYKVADDNVHECDPLNEDMEENFQLPEK